MPDPQLTAVRLSGPARRRRRCKIDVDQQKLTALGPQPERRQHHAVDRLGRPLRQRLHRPGPGQARLCPGRRALSRPTPQSLGQWYVRSSSGEMAPFSSFAHTGWATDAEQPVALPGRALRSNSRASRRRASARARRWTRCEQLAGADPRHQRRLGRPILSGAAVVRTGAAALRDLAARRLPVPRRALRELVDPGRGAARDPARPRRRDLRGHAARAPERRLSPDRPADDDGPGGEERDPDDRVRRAGREARACASSMPRSRRRGSVSGRS